MKKEKRLSRIVVTVSVLILSLTLVSALALAAGTEGAVYAAEDEVVEDTSELEGENSDSGDNESEPVDSEPGESEPEEEEEEETPTNPVQTPADPIYIPPTPVQWTDSSGKTKINLKTPDGNDITTSQGSTTVNDLSNDEMWKDLMNNWSGLTYAGGQFSSDGAPDGLALLIKALKFGQENEILFLKDNTDCSVSVLAVYDISFTSRSADVSLEDGVLVSIERKLSEADAEDFSSDTQFVAVHVADDGTIDITQVEVKQNADGTWTLIGDVTVTSFSPFFLLAIEEGEWTAPFSDVEEDKWYYDEVAYVNQHGLMGAANTEGTLFVPGGAATRAQLVTILHRLEDEPSVNYLMDFEDVAEDTWYTEAVRWAASEKIVEGDGSLFYPTDPITRDEMVTILWRYAKYKGYDVSVGENTNILSYNDAAGVREWAIPAMQWACGAGVIGVNSDVLNPASETIRSEMAAMLTRFCAGVAE